MSRFLVALFILISVVLPASADKAKPNTLTPKEIADGWILLFDGETSFGWKIDGESKIADGKLILGGTKETTASPTTEFGSYDLQTAYHVESGFPKLRVECSKGTSGTTLVGGAGSVLKLHTDIDLAKAQQHSFQVKHDSETDKPSSIEANFTYGLHRTQLNLVVPAGAKLVLHDVKLRPSGQKPIFNGKDLTGWKEIPGKKSKFFVSDKGELRIKNGNGDLQTEEQWDDFVLQLEVFTHGKHLNSGVFFRCLPGQFWSGYECQIRNQWKNDDRTQPVDYGTGAIYNRQAARKVVSSDNEWFTMTIVAHGTHMASWVNGYQVTDFTDTRPPNESARKGTKIDKGPISLQGHDKTTDLSFRQIRIAELPKPAEKK